MAKSMSLHILLVLIFLILFFSSSLAIPVVTYNVISLGAKSDGRSDSTKAFLAAWAKACGSTAASTIYVPPGRYLLYNVVFQGQCRNNDITISLEMRETGFYLSMLMAFIFMVASLMAKVLACGLVNDQAIIIALAVPRHWALATQTTY
ncbi:hypothetical protein AB3S75_027156 [Citrus x aurantiifolia]